MSVQMPQRGSEVFELEVGARTRDGYPLTTVHASAGDATARSWMDPKDQLLQGALAAVETRTVDRKGLRDLGDALFRGLFAEPIGSLYRSSLSLARERGQRLMVRLRIQPPELACLPWEYLHDPQEDAFLAISSETALLRYVPVGVPVRIRSVGLPLRVLVLIASPRDGQPLDVEQEKSAIQAALADLVEQKGVELHFQERATVLDIDQAIHDIRPHIFHFVGHGLFDGSQAFVVLEDDEGKARPVDEGTFREFFTGSEETRLVVLNACLTATTSSSQPLVGLAPRVLQRQVPAVVAMQYAFLDRAAIVFSQGFYRSLARDDPVDVAISEARKSIYLEMGAQHPDWGIPVLFLRAPDGRLWQMEEARAEALAGREASIGAPRDVAPPAATVPQGSSVTIQNVQGLYVQGGITGRDRIVITDSQAVLGGRDASLTVPVDWPSLVEELEALAEALDRVVEQGEIDAQEGRRATAELQAAVRSAARPKPEPDKITQRLNRAKEIIAGATAGVGAAAGLVAALTRAVELISQLVR